MKVRASPSVTLSQCQYEFMCVSVCLSVTLSLISFLVKMLYIPVALPLLLFQLTSNTGTTSTGIHTLVLEESIMLHRHCQFFKQPATSIITAATTNMITTATFTTKMTTNATTILILLSLW